MLQKQTVQPGTFSILNKLMEIPELSDFFLVGDTALSLKYGHRKSIDLDLFSTIRFDHNIILESLKDKFGDKLVYRGDYSKWGIFCFIDSVKVDLVYYPHQQISSGKTIENIRFYDDDDLIAMKIQAILGRGKKKDFWDIAELFSHYTMDQMISYHKKKYPSQMLGISIPYALTYFTDADESEDPETLKIKNWDEVKKIISQKVREFLI